MKRVDMKAYAKINLYLDVVSKLNSGFHGIESVMQTVSLADEVSIEAEKTSETEITLFCDSPYAPNDDSNIAHRAARLYLECAGIKAKVKINIKKNVPSPAGMGGGSADAAAVLRGMNIIFDSFSADELVRISAEIGSDVPFCIRGGTQLAKGRGEELSRIADAPECFYAIGCGDDLLSTSAAYKLLDEKYGGFPMREGGVERFLSSVASIDEMSGKLYNIFEEVAKTECPSVAKIKNILMDAGARGALMCGSGPSVFGFFDDAMSAQNAAEMLQRGGFFASVATNVKQYY